MGELSLQDRYAPDNRCFGCGPKNDKGLRIKSFPRGDREVVAEFRPEPHHAAFGTILNGGIAGALLDCHSNWAAIWAMISERKMETAPSTVTADFHVVLKRPTPLDAVLQLHAEVTELSGDRAIVESSITANGKVTATCRGTFIAVQEGHPGYHRWSPAGGST